MAEKYGNEQKQGSNQTGGNQSGSDQGGSQGGRQQDQSNDRKDQIGQKPGTPGEGNRQQGGQDRQGSQEREDTRRDQR